jgi:hypothetical protein
MILDHSGRQRKPFLPRKEAFDLYVALIGRPARLMGYVRDTREKVSQDVSGLKTTGCKLGLLCQSLLKSIVS